MSCLWFLMSRQIINQCWFLYRGIHHLGGVRLLHPRSSMIGEEADFEFPAQLRDSERVCTAGAIVYHRCRATNWRVPFRQVIYSRENREFVYLDKATRHSPPIGSAAFGARGTDVPLFQQEMPGFGVLSGKARPVAGRVSGCVGWRENTELSRDRIRLVLLWGMPRKRRSCKSTSV